MNRKPDQQENRGDAMDFAVAHDRARLARDVYKKPEYADRGTGDWEEVTNAAELGYPKHSSSFAASLYKRTDEKTGKEEYAIAYRGMTGVDDLDDAVIMAVIGFPKQFYDAYEFAQEVAETYGIDLKETEFTGHSMGGYLAQAVGVACNAENIWMFNSPAMRDKDMLLIPDKLAAVLGEDKAPHEDDIDYTRLGERITAFRTQNDLVARLRKSHGAVLQGGFEKKPHSIAAMEKLLEDQASGTATEGSLFKKQEEGPETGRKMMSLFVETARDLLARRRSQNDNAPQNKPPRRKGPRA
ncbi:MAG: hypothetical protein EP349_00375 [Alphaproteobacteria bacterium]|nr:MAG: hypothetical protein EP349_00375 [Alphaproteobacteria bacterium]